MTYETKEKVKKAHLDYMDFFNHIGQPPVSIFHDDNLCLEYVNLVEKSIKENHNYVAERYGWDVERDKRHVTCFID